MLEENVMIEKIRLTTLVEDSTSTGRPDLLAKYGLSFLIEAQFKSSEKTTILMDAGQSSEVISHNIKAMNLDLRDIDLIFLSHGHFDHTGGLLGALRLINKQVPILAHPEVFNPKIAYKPHLKFIGPPFKLSDVESAGGLMLFARNPITVAKGIVTSGEVERKVHFEEVKDFWTIKQEKFTEDVMMDDQALIINLSTKGLVVVTGCAHSGIINIINHAQKVTAVNRIYAVIGGFHLIRSNDKAIQATVDEMVKLGPKIIRPCHCTGLKAINRLINAFGENCDPIRTGDIVQL
jgi:7,8-dihydropterin-6-yl-methyl-4-(beta-D-ribofuranosyl)aminobenzene 5'-phosphate synthase